MIGSSSIQSELPGILSSLKKAFRAQGLTYREIAGALGVSLTSVKRYMSGGAISAQDLERLCQVAGLRFSELVELARREEESQGGFLTEDQEAALVDDQDLTLLFFLLRRGLTAKEIRVQLGVGEPRLVSLLAKLDRLRLIDLLPGNKVRILAPSPVRWRDPQRMRRSTYEFFKQEFLNSRFEDDSFIWHQELLQLSPAQVEELAPLCEELMRTSREMSMSGSRLPRVETAWYGLWTMIQPIRLGLYPESRGDAEAVADR